MTVTTAYDPANIFAKILRGEIPAHKVYEDATAFAFMDIMPIVDGHCLVIPKKPVRNIFDIAPDDLAALVKVAQKVSLAACKAFNADGHTLRPRMSIGLTEIRRGEDIEDAVHRADSAMYTAKAKGGDRVEVAERS